MLIEKLFHSYSKVIYQRNKTNKLKKLKKFVKKKTIN